MRTRQPAGLTGSYNDSLDAAMAYNHDLFVSYMHDETMQDWVLHHFLPFVRSFVGNALNRPINVFLDRDGIAAGDAWPRRLQNALAHSRALLPVWTPLYFHSAWCRRELAVMMHRERQLGYRSAVRPEGIVVPVNVFDGDFFPDAARKIEWLDCRDYWLIGEGFKKTEKYIQYQDLLRKWAVDAAKAIAAAPAWNPEWIDDPWFAVPDGDLQPKPPGNFVFTGLE